MLNETRLKNWMGIVLQVSLIIAISLTIIGGTLFLWAHGQETLQPDLLTATPFKLSFSPLGLIEIAMLVLVIAQVARVAILCTYYTMIRDYWFMLFSFFILAVILYSLIWQ